VAYQSAWRYQPRALEHDKRTPSRLLPEHGLRAELWVGPTVDDPDDHHFDDPQYVSTDQVCFRSLASGEAVPLAGVPPLVFSEVMRDVDVFVSVASLGNDPFAGTYGPEARRRYWQHYAFGELEESARTRKSVLERLLPRLTALAGRWSLAERFLIVRGELHTYKIHLGSGNVLMDPNDRYLCIVRDQNSEAGARISDVFLPFEGDFMLSTILSKALLLAADRAITDPSIIRQL
jgi:hypothetical protein